jgi:hypothetical protein
VFVGGASTETRGTCHHPQQQQQHGQHPRSTYQIPSQKAPKISESIYWHPIDAIYSVFALHIMVALTRVGHSILWCLRTRNLCLRRRRHQQRRGYVHLNCGLQPHESPTSFLRLFTVAYAYCRLILLLLLTFSLHAMMHVRCTQRWAWTDCGRTVDSPWNRGQSMDSIAILPETPITSPLVLKIML